MNKELTENSFIEKTLAAATTDDVDLLIKSLNRPNSEDLQEKKDLDKNKLDIEVIET